MAPRIRTMLNDLKALVLAHPVVLRVEVRGGEVATFPAHVHKATGEVDPAIAFDWNDLMTALLNLIAQQ